VALLPLQEPEAVQEVALLALQLRVTVCPVAAVLLDMLRLTTGVVPLELLELLEPPPPPQPASKELAKSVAKNVAKSAANGADLRARPKWARAARRAPDHRRANICIVNPLKNYLMSLVEKPLGKALGIHARP
jgi:hypothetical protein